MLETGSQFFTAPLLPAGCTPQPIPQGGVVQQNQVGWQSSFQHNRARKLLPSHLHCFDRSTCHACCNVITLYNRGFSKWGVYTGTAYAQYHETTNTNFGPNKYTKSCRAAMRFGFRAAMRFGFRRPRGTPCISLPPGDMVHLRIVASAS